MKFNRYDFHLTPDDFGYEYLDSKIYINKELFERAISGNKGAEKIILDTINPKSDGVKYDTGKPLVGTLCRIFPNALLEVGKCIEFGTHKYPEVDNWQRVDDAFNRYQDAMIRHLLKHNIGKEIDEETGLLHLSHMVWNALAILELYIRSKENES